jgi:hypothetical protein
MRTNRVFLPQETVDLWLAEGRVALEGERLRLLPAGPEFHLTTAVSFKSEVAGGGDEHQLCGKVKSVEEVTALLGEVAGGSVVLGDNAYEVIDGFLGELAGSVDGVEALAQLMKAHAGG